MRDFTCAITILFLTSLAAFAQGDNESSEAQVLIGDLVRDLRSDSEYVRRLARDTLVKMNGDLVVARLARLLDDPSDRARAEAATILGRLGLRADEAVPALRKVVENDTDTGVRRHALRALSAIRPHEPLPVATVVAMVKSGDMGRVDLALTAIIAMGTRAKDAEDALARLLRETTGGADATFRSRVVRALGSVHANSDAAVAALFDYAMLEGRTRGRLTLDDLNALRSVAPILLALLARRPVDWGDNDAWVVQLARVADGPSDALVELARAGPADRRLRAIRMLARMGPGARGALSVLIESTRVPAASLRRAAADALGAIGPDAKPAIPALLALLGDDSGRARLWAAKALGSICAQTRDELGLANRMERARGIDAEIGNAITAGLDWLAAHQDQDEDGKWDCDGFMRHDPAADRCEGPGQALFDVGVTGLAVLAFLGAGYTDRGSKNENKYAQNVRMGLRYLMNSQAEDGVFGTRRTHSFIYNHAIATLALCEAYGITRDPIYVDAARGGIRFIERSRNPDSAWRYDPRGGENDTSITGWCFLALKTAESAGLSVDRAAYRGTRAWINKMTDSEFGQVGYNYPGGAPARPEGKQDRFPPEKSQSMTAAGILIRIFLGEPRASDLIKKGANLCVELPPAWNPDDGSIDMYYWFCGTHAMFQVGGVRWRKWWQAMNGIALKSQRDAGSGARAASWDPVGVWGDDGGRVFATAMMLLCLEAPVRCARVALDQSRDVDATTRKVVVALKDAVKSDDAVLAKAARDALAIIE